MHTNDKTLKIRAAIDRPIREHNFKTLQYLIVQKEKFRHKVMKSGCSLKNWLTLGQKSLALNQYRADRYLSIWLNPKLHVGILEG